MTTGTHESPSDRPPKLDFTHLLQRVENLVSHIECSDGSTLAIRSLVDVIVSNFRDDLGIYGGRLYESVGDAYVLRGTFQDARPVETELRIPRTYEPIARTLMNGSVFMSSGDPGIDSGLEQALGVRQFAAIEVQNGRFILGFNVAPGASRDQVLSSLGVVRYAVNQRLHNDYVNEIFHQARQIQASILPTAPPVHGDYDIAGRSMSLDSVGGDLFDYIPITEEILGIAIADASGHGLPAALQVRDVYMGLRMGMSRDFKIVRAVERINTIIHNSRLTSRFVSLFYGELERTGTFIYVNAGHPPPFHLKADGSFDLLREGGPVLGPLPRATYERGFCKLEPGDLIVAYTDGITEVSCSAEETFSPEHELGTDRLIDVCREHAHQDSESILDAIFETVERWCPNQPADDDRTAIVLKKR